MKTVKINENTLKKIVSATLFNLLNEVKYYHGTPYSNSANNIWNNGLGGNEITQTNGGNGNGFTSAQGRQYLTKNPGNAVRYATMMDGDSKNGHVFEFDIDDLRELGVDEDEVGSLLYDYFNGKTQLPFRKELLYNLTQEELQAIKNGNFQGYAACKKIIDNLNDDEKINILQLSKSGNATISKAIKPTKHWIINRPDQNTIQQMSKDKDNFNTLNNYFEKNKRYHNH